MNTDPTVDDYSLAVDVFIETFFGPANPVWSDRDPNSVIGRRLAIVLSGIAILIGGTALYAAAIAHGLGGGLIMSTFLACLCYLLVISPWGIVSTYICERFPTHVRASGYGIGYSLAVVIPAFSGAYMLALQGIMPFAYTPVILLGLAGVLMIIGALMGPETRDVELHAVDIGVGSARPAQAAGG